MKRKIDMVNILFWTPGGQLLRNKRIITVTNIAAEVVEYVLQTFVLNTFLNGLAELWVDKGLIKNKKVQSDLIDSKGKGYRNKENTSENESNVESSSDREEHGKTQETRWLWSYVVA